MNTILVLVTVVFCILLAVTIFLLLKKTSGSRAIFKAQQEAKSILDKAAEEGESLKREASIVAKEKYLNLKTDFENQTRERRQKINEMERRLVNKEENLERRMSNLERLSLIHI